MSDFDQDEDLSSNLADAVVQITDSAGVPDDADYNTAVPHAVADEVESYTEFAERRDEHLAEQQPEDESEQVEQQPQGKRNVPLGALQEERGKRQQAQAQVAELQQQLAAHQAQLLQFQQWQQQLAAQQQQEAPIEFSDDPEGYIKQKERQFEQALADMQGANQQRQQIEQVAVHVQQALNDVVPYINQAEATFSQTHPDYSEAHAFVQQGIRNQLMAQNPGAAPEQIAAIEQLAAVQFISQCKANGVDPCQHIYNRAQQMGFQTAHRAPVKRAPTSLSSLPADGRAPDQRGAVNAKQIAAMSQEDFDAFFESMRRADQPQFGF
ncbi:hypothetical protein [Pseudomonas putida]|uniref:hypothetical protein n=1 Tax=Pseudomonas putida TaxID=303 RepID=UPI0039E00CAA